jgi:CXXX repeat peptide maturase
MINYLIVILEHNSVSFCYYDRSPNKESKLLSIKLLKNIVDYAVKNNITINFLYGDTIVPPEYEQIINTIGHIKLIPLGLNRPYDNSVFIIDAEKDAHRIDSLENSDFNNIILRISKEYLESLSFLVKQLNGKFKRLNVIWKDVDNFERSSFSTYESQLEDIRVLLKKEYRNGNFIEINIVTDRVFLTNMNNCNAGIEHLTIAPNGNFYLCPAFYYENEDNCLGHLEDKIEVKNGQLLELEYAPICRNCDAYHCKRCIYLNKKLTSEINTPSFQQCTLAHMERNISRKFLNYVSAAFDGNEGISSIPKISCLDPFEIINNRSLNPENREKLFSKLLSKPLENVPIKKLLGQIYKIDPNILTQLKNINSKVVNLRKKKISAKSTKQHDL